MDKNKLLQKKLRSKVHIAGDSARPRLNVFRSSKYIYAQLINDENGKVLASSSDLKIKEKQTKTERAKAVGKEIAEKAKDLKIKSIRFDRGGFLYHGRVKAVAEGARTSGLEF